ncbi:MAG: MBL fold metallo-hydrolase [Zhengella sp.]|uniref:MBL fold metallo-hydrolase n=1 Tax=Zhengella sp. TaxID=2282762 RepID=UPI0035283A02|nr:MBL fold metallo-hydrolase [Brucellaceae bacterium]
MRLSFHGAAGGVTGSCHLLAAKGKRILIDCGMFQGGRELHEENADDFGFDPASIDLLLLTHAHLDHCGRIPLLVKQGFSGEIICTAATRDLTRLVLLDSAHIHEEEARRRQRHGGGQGPLYDRVDALDSLEQFGRVARYGKPIDLGGGILATWHDAGHILGSASISLDVTEAGQTKRILFSGDIGPSVRPLLNEPQPPRDVDIVVMESTYGDRDHRSMESSVVEFHDAVRETIARGGNVVIPTFALERAQELLYFLREGMTSGELPKYLRVFLDSPMAISATRIYRRHPDDMKPEIAARLGQRTDPLDLPELEFVEEASESIALNTIRSGGVFLAGSGMCTGGRVRHHLRHNLGHEDCSVIFVGFAAEGTLARIIIDGARSVRLFGSEIPVRARIHTINGFSAHAGRSDLIAWHKRTGNPARTFLVHGEEAGRKALSEGLGNKGIEMPVLHQRYDL